MKKSIIIITSLLMSGCWFDGTGLGTDATSTNSETNSDTFTSSPNNTSDRGVSDVSTSIDTLLTSTSTSNGTSSTTSESDSTSSTTFEPSTTSDPSSTTVDNESEGIDNYCGDGILNQELGEQCDDGNEIDDDLCSNDCISARRIWISEKCLKGDMGGLNVADTLCNEEADKNGISKPVKAFMSDTKNSAVSRINSVSFEGYYICIIEGVTYPITKSWNGFQKVLFNGINCLANEGGFVPDLSELTWTGYNKKGEIEPGIEMCDDWQTNNNRTDKGPVGSIGYLAYWNKSAKIYDFCGQCNHVICIQSEPN